MLEERELRNPEQCNPESPAVKEKKPLTLQRKFCFSDPRDGFTVPVVVNEVNGL
jgi:hypothetical protein